MKSFIVALIFVSQTILLTSANEPIGDVQVSEVEEDNSSLATIIPGDLSMSDGVMRAVTTAGVLVTSIAGLAAILSYLLPLLGFRTCTFMGNCIDSDSGSTAYNHQGIASNSVYDQQGFSGYNYGGSFKKRSLEYVGPILKALSAAYDKYGPTHIQNQRRSNSAPVPTTAKVPTTT